MGIFLKNSQVESYFPPHQVPFSTCPAVWDVTKMEVVEMSKCI